MGSFVTIVTGNKENGDERQSAEEAASGTRRIRVQDLPPETRPPARGRRLETPTNEFRDPPRATVREQRYEHSQQTQRDARSQSAGRHANHIRSHSGSAPGSVQRKGSTAQGSESGVNAKRILMIIGGMIGVPVILIGGLLLLPSRSKNGTTGETQASTAATSPVAASAPADVTVANQAPTHEPSVSEPPAPTEVPNPGSETSVDSGDIRAMSMQLASQISQKSGYQFSPEFVELIRAHTKEYESSKAMLAARQYRREINKSFRDVGLNPLIGYALAMSRSKFDASRTDRGLGIWQVPPTVVRSQGYLGPNESGGKLRNPESSAQITASYTKQLLSLFDTEDFMYAIACFGMGLQEAGRLQARLATAAPEVRNRRDITKMIQSQVLSADQADNIARFFAAGIVGENPQKFGLEDSHPFSSLY